MKCRVCDVSVTDAESSGITVITLGVLLAVFFVAFIIAVIYIIYIRRKLQGTSASRLMTILCLVFVIK